MTEPHEAAGDESERRFRCLTQAMPQIVWTAGEDGRLEYCNDRWFEYTGLTAERTVESGWQSVVHPDDLERVEHAWAQAVAHRVPFESECRLRRASDGAYRSHLVRALPYPGDAARPVRWLGGCTDTDGARPITPDAVAFAEQLRLNEREMSARKRAEAALRASSELFRQVEEQAPIGLALFADDGTFMRVNPALCALTGYSKDELLSTQYHVLLHPADHAAGLAYVAQIRLGTAVTKELETRYLRKDGDAVWSLMTVSVVKDDSGSTLYFIAQIQDITARKFIEQVVQRAQDSALSSMRAKARFLATMSHELRTPMNGIIGMLELLSLTPLDEEQLEYVEVVRASSISLLNILNDILDFSKIEAGKLHLENIDFDLTRHVRSVVALLAPQATAKGVTLTWRVECEAGTLVRGDAGRVGQILMNLIANAVKFTPGGGEVHVSVVAALTAGAATNHVRYTVVDSGVGIAEDLQDRLFQPFSQLDDSTTRKFGGTGLGLAICKQLVELMGGEIGFDKTVSSGSSFWFAIPFSTGKGAVRGEALAEPLVTHVPVSPRNEKLLLAEDNATNALLAIKQFSRLGFGVTLVANGREAVAAVEGDRFDIVFMDCHMPVMDGLDATREIRRQAAAASSRIPIVAITANAQTEDREECLAAGMDDYMAKPSTLAGLQSMLERWLPRGGAPSPPAAR